MDYSEIRRRLGELDCTTPAMLALANLFDEFLQRAGSDLAERQAKPSPGPLAETAAAIRVHLESVRALLDGASGAIKSQQAGADVNGHGHLRLMLAIDRELWGATDKICQVLESAQTTV